MSEWKMIQFHKLAAGDAGAFSIGPFGSKIRKENYVEDGVPVVRGVNLAKGIFVDNEFVFISDQKADELMSSNLLPGDLVFTHRGTIGQVSMIPRQARYGRYILSSSQVKARLDQELACPEFYYYWFRSPDGQYALLANSSTVGVPGIASPLSTIRSLKVPYPSRQEQQAIATVLGSLDDKIALNDRLSTTYESILRCEFESLRIDEEPLDAEKVLVSELVDVNPVTARPDKDREAVYVDMAALSTESALVRKWVRRLPRSGARFMNGDALLARITPCLENGKAGYVDFMEDGEVGIGSTEFIVLRARPGVPSQVAYFLTRSTRFREHAIRNMSGSSGRQRVSADVLAAFPLTKPDAGRLMAFGELAAKVFNHIKSLDQEARYLGELRDALLPGLMSGEIRVRDAEQAVEAAT